MKDRSKTFEWVLNIASLACIVMVLGVGAHRFFSTKPDSISETSELAKGAQVNLPNVNWAENRSTLIMALAVGCHYCKESAGFYRSLIESNTNNSFHPIAVLPQEVPESRKYLAAEGIKISDVHQDNLARLGINGTPTLILVNSSGRIDSAWIGKLSSDQEAQVYATLGITSRATKEAGVTNRDSYPPVTAPTQAPAALVTPSEFAVMIHGKAIIPVVDVRGRP